MEHISKQYERELQELQEKILFLGGTVEEMLSSAIRSLLERDPRLAQQVIDTDPRVDAGEIEVDHLCLNLLALRQPAGSDLRIVTTALKIVTDIERIGDVTVNIAERAIELSAEPPLKPYIDIPRMANEATRMLHDALDAFVKRDRGLAESVLASDNEVDDLNAQIFRELLTYMIEDPKTVSRAMRITFIAKYIERIADHATNIAQMVIFMREGHDVRHPGVHDVAR